MAISEVEILNQKSRHPFMVSDCLPQPLVVIKILKKNYQNELLFEKKYRHQFDIVNLMYDHESPKVTMFPL